MSENSYFYRVTLFLLICPKTHTIPVNYRKNTDFSNMSLNSSFIVRKTPLFIESENSIFHKNKQGDHYILCFDRYSLRMEAMISSVLFTAMAY